MRFTGDKRANFNLSDSCINNFIGYFLSHHNIRRSNNLAGCGIANCLKREAADKAFLKRFKFTVTIHNCFYNYALFALAIVITDDNILRNIYKAAGKVT